MKTNRSDIWRRWARTSYSVMRSSWWENWEAPDAGFLMALMLPMASIPMELALWGIDYQLFSSLDFLGQLDGRWWLAALACLLLVNGLLVERLLVRKSPQDGELRPWVRRLRRLIGAAPLAGLFIIGLWKGIARRKPSWAFMPPQRQGEVGLAAGLGPLRHSSPLLLKGRRRLQHWARRLEGSGWWAGWTLAANTLFLLLISTWAASIRPIPPGRRAVAVSLTALFHLAAFLGIRQYALRLAGKIDRPALRAMVQALSLGWLIPVPGLGLILLVAMMGLEDWGLRSETLVAASYRLRQSPSRLEAWTRLRQSQKSRPWWRRSLLGETSRVPAPGVHTRRLRAFYRIKTLLLGIDGIGLGYLSVAAARVWPPAWPWMRGLLLGGAFLCAAIAALACLAAVWGFFGSLSSQPHRSPSMRFSPANYLAAAGSVFPIGILTGLYLAFGQAKEAGLLLALTPAAVWLLSGIWMIVGIPFRQSKREGPKTTVLWLLLGLPFIGLGLLLLLGEETAQQTTAAAALIALASPLWNAALAAGLLSWLLLPFRPKDVLDPALPKRLRRPLQLLTVVAVLPLGGLAVPFWIWFRRRRWAELRRDWRKRNPSQEVNSP